MSHIPVWHTALWRCIPVRFQGHSQSGKWDFWNEEVDQKPQNEGKGVLTLIATIKMPETGSIRTNKDSGKENSSTIYLFHIKNEIMFQILRSPYPIGFGYDETSHIINSHKIPSSTLSEVIIYLLTYLYYFTSFISFYREV